jgi:hypothetical protein
MYDVEETKRRGYSGKSKVYFDGRERLAGKDWTKRKKELWIRSGGRCEWVETHWEGSHLLFLRCKAEANDPDHIVKRSVLRDDRLPALQALCRGHHQLKHAERNPRFGEASQLRSKRLLGVG